MKDIIYTIENRVVHAEVVVEGVEDNPTAPVYARERLAQGPIKTLAAVEVNNLHVELTAPGVCVSFVLDLAAVDRYADERVVENAT